MLRLLLSSILGLTVHSLLFCQSQPISIVTTKKSGDWNDPSTWVRNQLPAANDQIVLRHDVYISQPSYCKSINLNGHNLTVMQNTPLGVVGQSNTVANSATFSLFNKAISTSSQLVAQYSFPTLDLDCFLYGIWDIDTIKKITSVSFRKKSAPDTTLNFLFNDSLEVTHYYMDVAGVKDTTLFRINYQKSDSVFVAYQLYTNWRDTVLFRRANSVFIGADTSYLYLPQAHKNSLQSNCGSTTNLPNLTLGDALFAAVGVALAAAPFVVAMPAVATVVYFATGLKMLRNTLPQIYTAIDNIFGIPSACADEIPSMQNDLMPDPTPPLSNINPQSPLLTSCPCSWNFGVVANERAINGFPPGVTSITYATVPHTGGYPPSGQAASGITFPIPRQTVVTYTIGLQYFLDWPPNPNGSTPWSTVLVTKTFHCH